MNESPHARLRAIRRIVMALVAIAFLYAIVETTNWLYSKTSDVYALRPDNILSGLSEAPNQYRILVPLLNRLLRSGGHLGKDESDRLVILASIILCYAAAGALFYKSSRSFPLTMLALVALLGSFAFGMVWKYRQEFFEVAFVALFFLVLNTGRPRPWSYALLALITVLGSLNRETFVFCISGMAVHLWSQGGAPGRARAVARDAVLAAGLFLIVAAVFVGVRYHFGLSRYYGGFWKFRGNLANVQTLMSPMNAVYMGSGMLLAYVTTLLCGNREYLPFILGYGIPMLLVAFFISNFDEHRIFYPLMVLLIASILSFAAKRRIVGPGAEGKS